MALLHVSVPTVPDAVRLLPDEGEPFINLDFCCDGAALRGREYCTCWEPIFDLMQEPSREGPLTARAKCCHDCAFRQGSPERESGDLDDIGDRPFHCHQGVRRAIGYYHRTTLIIVPTGEGDYQPPLASGRLWKADGTPGELCAGYVAISGVAR